MRLIIDSKNAISRTNNGASLKFNLQYPITNPSSFKLSYFDITNDIYTFSADATFTATFNSSTQNITIVNGCYTVLSLIAKLQLLFDAAFGIGNIVCFLDTTIYKLKINTTGPLSLNFSSPINSPAVQLGFENLIYSSSANTIVSPYTPRTLNRFINLYIPELAYVNNNTVNGKNTRSQFIIPIRESIGLFSNNEDKVNYDILTTEISSINNILRELNINITVDNEEVKPFYGYFTAVLDIQF